MKIIEKNNKINIFNHYLFHAKKIFLSNKINNLNQTDEFYKYFQINLMKSILFCNILFNIDPIFYYFF